MSLPWRAAGGGIGRQGRRAVGLAAPPCGLAPPPGYFERLLRVVERIARHASFPGKQSAVEKCMEEVGDLIAAGRITAGEGAVLADILSGRLSPGRVTMGKVARQPHRATADVATCLAPYRAIVEDPRRQQ